MKKVCFVCTGNTCRSQIAEGFAKKFGQGKIEVYSAGSHPYGSIIPKTIETMKEIGIDISNQRSKSINNVPMNEMDYIITLCEEASSACPVVREGGERLHWPMEDPFGLAGSEEKVDEGFRKVRDKIGETIKAWLETVT